MRGGAENGVEHLGRDRHEIGMGDPRPIEPIATLALLVLADLGERPFGDLGVAPVRDERGHPADGVSTAPMARGDEQLGVRPHEWHGHGQLRTVGRLERRR